MNTMAPLSSLQLARSQPIFDIVRPRLELSKNKKWEFSHGDVKLDMHSYLPLHLREVLYVPISNKFSLASCM